MSFLSGILSCCEPKQKRSKLQAETEFRGPHIVGVHDRRLQDNGSIRSSNRTNASPPPRYCDIAGDTLCNPLVDEKSSDHLIMGGVQRERSLSPAPSVDASDESSVISMPSTRWSGLTSQYTGATDRSGYISEGRGQTTARTADRSSLHAAHARPQTLYGSSITSEYGHDSPPPSYYAESDAGEEAVEHPVMANGWLDRLRRDAERNLVRADRRQNRGGS